MVNVRTYRRQRLSWAHTTHPALSNIPNAPGNSVVVPCDFEPNWLYVGQIKGSGVCFMLEVNSGELGDDRWSALLPTAAWGHSLPAELFARGPEMKQNEVALPVLKAGTLIRSRVLGLSVEIGWFVLDGHDLGEMPLNV